MIVKNIGSSKIHNYYYYM